MKLKYSILIPILCLMPILSHWMSLNKAIPYGGEATKTEPYFIDGCNTLFYVFTPICVILFVSSIIFANNEIIKYKGDYKYLLIVLSFWPLHICLIDLIFQNNLLYVASFLIAPVVSLIIWAIYPKTLNKTAYAVQSVVWPIFSIVYFFEWFFVYGD